jgi:hypothetical protein
MPKGSTLLLRIFLKKEVRAMPGFDRTGPMGRGPRSGWGRGLCGTYTGQGPAFGGRGRGFGRRCWAPWGYGAADIDERRLLQEEMAALKGEKEALERRLAELEQRGD